MIFVKQLRQIITMHQFTAFIRKEFYHIFRDKRTMLILIVMPIVQIVLFGFAISSEIRNIHTAVFAHSNNSDTRYLVNKLDASEYFSVDYVVNSEEELETLFRRNKIELALVLSPDYGNKPFSTDQLQILSDATEPNQGVTRGNYALFALAKIISEKKEAASVLPNTGNENINVMTKMLYNPQMKSAYNFVPGVMGLILMLVCAMMTSVSVVREKEYGTMEVLLVSPVSPLFVVVAKAVPYIVLSLVNLATILLLSVFVLGVPISGSFVALVLVSLLFIVVSLSLGLFISTVTNTQLTALLVSAVVLMIPTLLLSGIIFPVESMPLPLQIISCIIPARWFVEIVRRIMIEGAPVIYLYKEILILFFMAVLLIIVTVKKFKSQVVG